MNKSNYLTSLVTSFELLLLLLPATSAHGDIDDVILWNKLGSVEEITNSEIGENGALVGSQYAFEPAQHDNGYVRTDVGQYLRFPASVVEQVKSRGTIELWINPKVPQPIPYQYGIFGFLGATYGHYGVPAEDNIGLAWGDTVTRTGIVGTINLGNTSVSTSDEPQQFVAQVGVPFHVAMAWDINGIDGTSDTIRAYRDGVMVGSTTDLWNPNVTAEHDIIMGYGPDSGGYDKYILDNFIVWNHAKTDFSDRFGESPAAPGGTVAFVGSDDAPYEGVDSDIYIMNADGTDVKPYIVHPARELSPVFSPDGKKLAFISNRSGQWAIYIINTDGTGFYKVPNSEFSFLGELVNNAVNWSHDGESLVYLATSYEGGLGTINIDGTGNTILTTNGVGDGVYEILYGASWSASMDELIVHAFEYPWHQNIFKYTISDNTWTQMTADISPSHVMDAAISRNGESLVFTRRASYAQLYDLYVMENRVGAPSINLTNFNLNEHAFHAEWINNDKEIIFNYTIYSPQHWRIGAINTDGTNFRLISPISAPQHAMYPTWTPNSVTHIPGDLNGNSTIDIGDYQALRNSIGKCTDDQYFNPDADYDEDGCVSYNDYRIWYTQFYQ
jgi:Tol biopolymer transport system component